MHKLLIKIFIKNHHDLNNPIVRSNYGKLAGFVGIISNFFLSIFKIIIGFISMSVSILADGINNLSDAGASIVTLVGFKLASMPPDEHHPYGHQRIEYLSGVIVSFIIIMVGVLLGKSSIERIINPVEISINFWLLGTLTISLLIKLWQGFFYLKIGSIISSKTLKATSTDSFNDFITTTVIIIGIGVYLLSNKRLNIDGYLGVLVSIYIIISGIKLIKDTMNPLIGTIPDEAFVNLIDNKIKSYPGVLGIHDLVVHSYGPNQIFITVHVEVASNQDIMISHDLIDKIERDFRRELKLDLVIHMDPVDIDDQLTKELKQIVETMILELDYQLSIHDFRIIKKETKTNVLFDIVIPPKYEILPNELKKIIIDKINKYDPSLEAIIKIDEFYLHNSKEIK